MTCVSRKLHEGQSAAAVDVYVRAFAGTAIVAHTLLDPSTRRTFPVVPAEDE
jgi:hypothetical protein